jgi:membrane-bound lytic murein transglycosylase MltF
MEPAMSSQKRTELGMLKRTFQAGLFFVTLFLWLAIAADENSVNHPLDSHLSYQQTEDLPGIKKNRYIRVLTSMNRTNFFISGPKIHGFEYSLLKEYETYLNKGIKRSDLKLVMEFIPVPRDRLFSDLVAGYGDIAAAGLTITKERSEKVDFTLPYLAGIDELLVSHKGVIAPGSAKALSGRNVFVRPSSSYFESLEALNRKLIAAKRPPVTILKADENLETEDILELVNSGAIQMTVCDSHLARTWAKVLPDITVHERVKLREGAEIAWAMRKSNPQLKASLDRFVKGHRSGTLLGNIFFERYYKDNDWIIDPLKGKAAKKVERYKPIIKKYANQYNFDWRLILSMAFQESGLNPNKKSTKGAVGLMQVKPSTAADPKVGIADITSVEDNIHAGVKYLDLLRRNYFNDQAMRPRDRVRFSLAAYNAGPTKIRLARKKARQMKLDHNRWFRNVEVAVLRSIGQETVRYVSNINKYYVIYTNAQALKEAKNKVKQRVRN